MKLIFEPTVRLIGRQVVDETALAGLISDNDASGWTTDTEVGAEKLVEVAGRLCYWSFAKPRPGGNSAYINHILEVGHGSVCEHAVYNLIFEGVSRSLTHELVRHRAGMGYCLTGDAVVYSGARENGKHNGVKKSWTMKQLWEWSQDWRRKSRIKLIKVRTFDGEKFVPAGIKAVARSGEKAVYKMTLTDGKVIRASADHLFLTGWNRVQNYPCWTPVKMIIPNKMSVGCNGRPVGSKLSEETKQKIRETKIGENNPMWKGNNASAQAGRLRAQKAISTFGRRCHACGADHNLHRHHIDGDTLNNSPGNIGILCATCHQHEHHLGKEMTVKWVTVASIEPDGFEMTYDLEIDHPCHNFVANGIVTHNSQLSQRFVDESDCAFVVPPLYAEGVEFHEAWERQEEFGDRYHALARLFDARGEEGEILFDIARVWSEEMKGMQQVYAKLATLTDRLLELRGHTDRTARRKAAREAARSVLPNATETKIFVTGNARALRHFLELRGDVAADAEIRRLAIAVWRVLANESPNLFGDIDLATSAEGVEHLSCKHRKV